MTKKDKQLDGKSPRVRATRMSKEARREQLVACAIKVFADKGFGGANHALLADEAGVAVPTAFHYFPTKDHLIDAVVTELSRFLIDEFVRKNIATPENGLTAIHKMLVEFADSISLNPDYVRVWLQWSGLVKEPIWQTYQKFEQQTVEVISVLLERGKSDGTVHAEINTKAACITILSFARGVALMKFGGATRRDVLQVIDSLVVGYLNGYRKNTL